MMTSYILTSGHTGIAFSALSYVDYFKITCMSDISVLSDPQTLIDLMEKNIKQCYEFEATSKGDTGGLTSAETSPSKVVE